VQGTLRRKPERGNIGMCMGSHKREKKRSPSLGEEVTFRPKCNTAKKSSKSATGAKPLLSTLQGSTKPIQGKLSWRPKANQRRKGRRNNFCKPTGCRAKVGRSGNETETARERKADSGNLGKKNHKHQIENEQSAPGGMLGG